jgi:hypothetical protein
MIAHVSTFDMQGAVSSTSDDEKPQDINNILRDFKDKIIQAVMQNQRK